MPETPLRVCVLGSGSWGTALAHHLRRSGADVSLWGRDESVLSSIADKGVNPKYLSNLNLAAGIVAETDLVKAVSDKELIVLAVPSSVLRSVVCQVSSTLKSSDAILLSGIKGFESETLMTATQVLVDEIGAKDRVAALGGPSFAAELIQGYPTAVTVAAHSLGTAEKVRSAIHFDNLRAYSSIDVIGVEFGGAVKNVMALATGLLDGVGMGHNARAALITRGLAEIQQLIIAVGGDARTIIGLSGLGDLLLTSVGDLSRNRQVGLRLGRGENLADIQKDLGQVAEGVRSTKLVYKLAQQHGVEMPIVEQTNAVLDGKYKVKEAIAELLAREPKHE